MKKILPAVQTTKPNVCLQYVCISVILKKRACLYVLYFKHNHFIVRFHRNLLTISSHLVLMDRYTVIIYIGIINLP